MNFDNEVPRRRFDDWIESQANQAGAERLFLTCKWTVQLEQFQSKIRNLKSGDILCDVKWKLASQVWNMQAHGQILEWIRREAALDISRVWNPRWAIRQRSRRVRDA